MKRRASRSSTFSRSSTDRTLRTAVQGAVHRALLGKKTEADAAGRLLRSIPANTPAVVMADVEDAVAYADPRFWLALEEARDRLYWDVPGATPHTSEGSATVLALTVEAVLADGRKRERAVRALAESRSLAALPVLGLRAADWVPNVRDAARQALVRRLDDDGVGGEAFALATVAPMAFLLAGRPQGRWLADEVTRRLARPESRVVRDWLMRGRARRDVYLVLLDSEGLDLDQAVQAALSDRDHAIKRRCATYAANLAVEHGSVAHALRLLTSRMPLIRAEALQALNRLGDLPAIEAALADDSGLVRATARFYLRPRGLDLPEACRRILRDAGDAVTPGAIAGLGEVGDATDIEVFQRLLGHPLARIRAEALRGLARLAPPMDTDELLDLVAGDPASAVVRQAATMITARGVAPDTDRLLALLDPANRVRVRLTGRQLLAARDDGWRLAVDALLLADPEPAVAERAAIDLASALKRQIYGRPKGEAAEILAAHLPDVDRLLPAEARMLRFVVGMPLPAGVPEAAAQPAPQPRLQPAPAPAPAPAQAPAPAVPPPGDTEEPRDPSGPPAPHPDRPGLLSRLRRR